MIFYKCPGRMIVHVYVQSKKKSSIMFFFTVHVQNCLINVEIIYSELENLIKIHDVTFKK